MTNELNTKISFKKGMKEITGPLTDWAPFFIVKSKDKTGVFYAHEDKEMIIGRKQDVDIYIDDEQASRKHASVIFINGKVKIVDLGSTNGTVVNGQQIKDKILEDGDEIIIGSVLFQFFMPMSIGDRISGISIKTHNYFEMRLTEELDRTARYERPLSLMMIGIDTDQEKTILEKKMAELVLVVKTLIRTMDILASYSKNEIELMLPETAVEPCSAPFKYMRNCEPSYVPTT